MKLSLAGHADGGTINSIPKYQNGHVTADYKLRAKGHMSLTDDFLRLVLLAIAAAFFTTGSKVSRPP